MATRMDDLDRRFVPVVFRAEPGDDGEKKPMLKGRAAVYDEKTLIGSERHGFIESIAPGAFAESIERGEVIATFNHNADATLARASNGSLRITDGPEGLDVEIDIDPDVTYAADVLRNVRSGLVSGMSIAFNAAPDGEEKTPGARKGDHDEYRIVKGELVELGPVVLPAYQSTSVSAARSERHRAAGAAEAKQRTAEKTRQQWLTDQAETKRRLWLAGVKN